MLCQCCLCYSREQLYNYNLSNGLPSNHVYKTLRDKNGYLWIATSNGVVKYNGYDILVFDISSGISNDDIWNIYEDQLGRIWLASISDEIGYIYNDKYHKAYVKGDISIYPTNFIHHMHGILFLSDRRKERIKLCIEKNDTIKPYNVNSTILPKMNNCFLRSYNQLIIWKDSIIYNYKIYNSHIIRKKIAKHPYVQSALLGHYLIPFQKVKTSDSQVNIINISTAEKLSLPIGTHEKLVLSDIVNNKYYISTDRRCMIFDHNFKKLEEINYDSLCKNYLHFSPTFVNVNDDYFWGKCYSTSDHGLFFSQPAFELDKSGNTFDGYEYVGISKDSSSYLWNITTKTLLKVDINNKISKEHLSIKNIIKIFPYKVDTSVLISDNGIYLLADNYIKPYTEGLEIHNNDTTTGIVIKDILLSAANDVLTDKNGAVHVIGIPSFYYIINKRGKTATIKIIDENRFNHIIYHEKSNTTIAYGNKYIYVHNEKQAFSINISKLPNIEPIKIEQILVSDEYVFLKTSDNLYKYNLHVKKAKQILTKYNLSKTTIHLYKDDIIAVGRYGIYYSSKEGEEYAYLNLRDNAYSSITSSFIINDILYLNTHKGTYQLSLKKTNHVKNTCLPQYNLIASISDKNISVRNNDTLSISQPGYIINFDFINPYGSGRVRYNYYINGNLIQDESNHLNIAGLDPGKYYELQLILSDDIIRTGTYSLYLYIEPHWWQTQKGKCILFVLGIILITSFSLLIVFVTKYILTQKHNRQRRILELELKSIYSQLNPHFIFNTLNSIIFFIRHNKNKEAYTYLMSFSKLLRYYIKSSRNKWTTIPEELENLKNYIHLQQVRFNQKFSYSIVVNEGVNVSKMFLPSLLLQPLVENAIQHGLVPDKKYGHLLIELRPGLENNSLLIIIDDNGVGRQATKHNNIKLKTQSYGSEMINDLKLIFERYNLLEIDIVYIDKVQPNTGTTVNINIKYVS